MTRTSKNAAKYTAWGLLATLAATVVSPVLADGQSDKNNMRNLAIAGAAVAGYGLLNHNNTATLLGAAGAVLAGSQYEQDRQQQSQDNNWGYDRRYHRTDNNDSNNGYTYNTRYNGDRSNGGQWRSDNRNNGYRDGRGTDARYDSNAHRDNDARRDNGRTFNGANRQDQNGDRR